jgi:hypothetical protein
MENNHAPGAGYSALLPPVILFAAATSSVWVFQINDQQVKWTPPIQNVYRSVTDGWPTILPRPALKVYYRCVFERDQGPHDAYGSYVN